MSPRRPIAVPRQGAQVAVAVAAIGAACAVLVVALLGFAPPDLAAWGAVLGVAVMASLVAAGLSFAAGRHLVRPLKELSERVGAIRASDAEPPLLGVRTPDPIGDLVERVGGFRSSLRESLEGHRRARRSAEQAEAYETEFLATVSHELRTPLNAILGFSMVLLDGIDGPLSDGQREDVQTIHASGEHLRDLVDEVLDLAAMQSGRFRLEIASVDVAPVVKEVARLLRGQLRGKPVRIEASVPPELPAVAADPRRLRQILVNLGTNALKFTDEGAVTLEAAETGDGVRLSVRDTGSGIRRDELATIFEEFTQVGDVRRKSQGSGLGLAICKRLLDLHDGRIEVESVVGEGSVFHVHLPRGSGS